MSWTKAIREMYAQAGEVEDDAIRGLTPKSRVSPTLASLTNIREGLVPCIKSLMRAGGSYGLLR